MQKIIICGNIATDCETRTIGKYDYHCFSVACNNTTSKGKETTFYRVNAIARPGSKIDAYLRKGGAVMVVGRPSYGVYKDNVEITIWADELEITKFLENKEGAVAQDDNGNKDEPY